MLFMDRREDVSDLNSAAASAGKWRMMVIRISILKSSKPGHPWTMGLSFYILITVLFTVAENVPLT